MDADVIGRHFIDQHSPTSSSSVTSDKENNSTRDILMTQRVKSIVSEFNKIANECDTTSHNFSRHNPSNRSINFHRQGFRNASMHVVPTGLRPNGHVYNKASSDSLNSFLLDNATKPAKLDRLTALQAACERKDTDDEMDKSDLFAVQTQRIRLQNRYADLAKLRSDASAATGGKRSAIIDKKARQCLSDADQKLTSMRERIDHLALLLEQHRNFEKLHDELDKWISDLQRVVQKEPANQDAQSIRAQMRNEQANFEELHRLSGALGLQQQKQYKDIAAKWNQVEQGLSPLHKQMDSVDANAKINEALNQINNLLGNPYDLNTSARMRKQLERIDQLEAFCQEYIQPAKVDELNASSKKDGWADPMTPKPAKSIPIYDECTQSISTSPSSDHSIPISSFTSSHVQIHAEPMELQAFLKSLENYNCVRFAAYRTGMKLFAVQKRLCLDLVEISELNREFNSLPAGIAQIPPESLFTVLRRVYEKAHVAYPRSVPDVQRAIRQCEEWLRLVSPNFDTRVVMLVLIVLCSGKLDDKYRYLFVIYATGSDNTATAADLHSLFADLAKLPALLHEDRTFGAANVESTVRSCLRASTYVQTQPIGMHPNGVRVLPIQNNTPASSIKSNNFWHWIRQDPQTLVWIRVMHRLVRSEFAKHNARCGGCKVLPIVGIRFRCLHCFNVDLCQNCFLTQKPIKGHKQKHEMHEYYTPTSTLDNIRDVSQILHNKLRRTRSTNKIGYTPIDLNLSVAQATDQQQLGDKSFTDGPNSNGLEVNVDAVIEKARREGRLPPPRPPQRRPVPLSTRWPNLNNQRPAALSPAASPEDLNRLIVELQRENSALWQAFERRQQLNESNGGSTNAPVIDQNAPPLLQRFDSSTRELAEAMNCLLALSDPTPANV